METQLAARDGMPLWRNIARAWARTFDMRFSTGWDLDCLREMQVRLWVEVGMGMGMAFLTRRRRRKMRKMRRGIITSIVSVWCCGEEMGEAYGLQDSNSQYLVSVVFLGAFIGT